ncbi:MAG: quinone-dependent dihydroorotate dehydrogenase [Bacteroidota bacterium]
MYNIILRLLFKMDAEKAHYFTLNTLNKILKLPFAYAVMRKLFFVENRVEFLGLSFPNRVGLAAGFDKNARYLKEFQSLGFGFVEIGTVTPLPQAGNEQPRLFRLIKDEAIINRMGFNNDGVDVIAERLKHRPKDLVVGGNIGKNKITPNELAQRDYEICFEKLYDVVDYFVVNVSSPNTPNLRALQDKEPLTRILSSLINQREEFRKNGKSIKPVLLKIAPDLTEGQLNDVVEIVKGTGIDGVVATNTTISRENLLASTNEVENIGMGGLSGKILFGHSTAVLRHLHKASNGTIPLIGVGGIDTVQKAKAKMEAGATLIQLYTGFIYKGPKLVKEIARLK